MLRVNPGPGTAVADIDTVAIETDDRRSRRTTIWGSAIGYATAGYGLLLLGCLMLPSAADLGLSQAQAASLVTATLFGAVIGGFTFGWLSDRLRRGRGPGWALVLFAVFSRMCALAHGV